MFCYDRNISKKMPHGLNGGFLSYAKRCLSKILRKRLMARYFKRLSYSDLKSLLSLFGKLLIFVSLFRCLAVSQITIRQIPLRPLPPSFLLRLSLTKRSITPSALPRVFL